jgi:hypothetical protein
MSETPDTAQSAVHHDHTGHRSSRLYQALAWVGIIAGVVFTVAVIFISGLILGSASGGHQGWHRGYQGYQGYQGGQGGCPMMRQGPMMGAGGMEPEDMGPGGMMKPGEMPPPPPAKPSVPPRP